MKTILITGGAGFVGSNIAMYLKKQYPDSRIIALDNLIRQGSELNVGRLQKNGVEFFKGDVREKNNLLALSKVDLIIECSAEPSVLAGHDDPQYMIDTNLIGVINCLELAKRDQADFIFLSTSRVYPIGELNAISFIKTETRFEWTEGFKGINELFPLHGVRSLYGASKLAAEHIILEYMDMYDLRVVINRLGVIAGPWQMGKVDQGILGYWLAQHMFGGNLKYIGYEGTGKQLRDVVHVDDVCLLIEKEMNQWDICRGKVFNAGGGKKNTFSLCELTQKVQELTGNSIDIGKVSEERKSDIRIYVTDNSLVTESLDWSPQKNVDDVLTDTKKWMEEYSEILQPIFGV